MGAQCGGCGRRLRAPAIGDTLRADDKGVTGVTRRIRVFVSSPGDVQDERRQCGEVIQELNTTLRALIPERDTELELVRWETHTHPDLTGSPQAVVDQQIDHDYEIFLGIMWSRFGHSNTYGWLRYRARVPRGATWLGGGSSPGSPSTSTSARHPWRPRWRAKMADVLAFRTELSQLGLVGFYEDRNRFRDKVRRDLILVLSRLLNVGATAPQVAGEVASRVTDTDLAIVRDQVRNESQEYQTLRDTMPPGDRHRATWRSWRPTLRSFAQSIYPLLPELIASDQPRSRLAAVCALQAIPTAAHIDWLAERVCVEKPFIGYHAALALLDTTPHLPFAQLSQVAAAVDRAGECSQRLRTDTDRANTLGYARRELVRRTR